MRYHAILKILHVITSFDPTMGGPPRIAIRLAAGAAALGHAVTVVSYASSEKARIAIADDHASVPGADRLTQKILPAPSRWERLTAQSAKKELAKIIPQFDVVHLHDAWSALSRGTMALANQLGVPFVLLPNGMFDPWAIRQKRWKKELILSLGYRQLLNKALFIHTGNVDEKAGVQLIGVTAPMEIIPNGIYPQEFDPLPEAGQFYAAHPELNGDPFILFLSRVHYKKGLDYLADAFAQIAGKYPQVRLVVAGPEEGAGEGFDRAISAAGLSDRVHRVGPIFGADRFTALVDCACFCLPSRQEGFSIAILEAMACARPVVITAACHFPEVATAGAGVVVDLNAAAVASGLDQVLSDVDKASAMGRRGRAMVQKHYTWPAIAAQLVGAYQTHAK